MWDGTNVFFLPIVNKSDTFEKTVNIAVLPNAEAKSHAIDISMSYEYVLNGARQKGEMTQQVAVQTMQPDRFSADPVSDLLETTVGEEITSPEDVNKSRGAATFRQHWSAILTEPARLSTSEM